MRIALISDIHGNLVALEAALAAIAEAGADQIVCLGDVAALGPQPREVIDSLRARGIPVVMGNTDAWLLDPQPHPYRDEDTQRVYEVESWCAQQLSATDLEFIRTFRPIVEIPLDTGASLLCFHGSPRSNTEIILSTTPPDELDGMLTGYNAALMAGGHTHTQMFRRHAQTAIINPGSVGLPFVRDAQGNVAYNPPWAEYAFVEWEGGGLSVALRRAPLDVDMVVRAAFESGMPHAEWWTKDWSRG